MHKPRKLHKKQTKQSFADRNSKQTKNEQGWEWPQHRPGRNSTVPPYLCLERGAGVDQCPESSPKAILLLVWGEKDGNWDWERLNVPQCKQTLLSLGVQFKASSASTAPLARPECVSLGPSKPFLMPQQHLSSA